MNSVSLSWWTHLFFFFLTIHTEITMIMMIMTAMNTTPATATEVAKMVAVDCEVVAVDCEIVAAV